MKRPVIVALSLIALVGAVLLGGAFHFAGKLVAPPWMAPNFKICNAHRLKYWGPECGNLRKTKQVKFNEVRVKLADGLKLTGWHIPCAPNGRCPANPGRTNRRALLHIHGGGTDRRQGTVLVDYFLKAGYDVYLMDFLCHGESHCSNGALTFGAREYRGVISAWRYIKQKGHRDITVYGTSTGASALLMALPDMPEIKAAVLENPFVTFERLVMETPAAPSFLPDWFRAMVVPVARLRGRFRAPHTPLEALAKLKQVPMLFVHSKKDGTIPYTHSVALHKAHQGPGELLIFEDGRHSALWTDQRAAFEKKMTAFLRKYARGF